MQFMIKALDGKDKLEKRLEVRAQHIENIQKVKEYGSVICAGGLLDEEGKMKGSFLILDFESKELFDRYLASEPYIIHKVWEDIQIEICNTVIQNDEIKK